MKSVLVGAGSALAFAFTLIAQPVLAEDFHCPKAGTVIGFTGGGTNTDGSFTFTGQSGSACQIRTPNGKTGSQFLGLTAAGTDFDKYAEALFPLQAGKQIEFTAKMDSSHLVGSATTSSDTYYISNTIKVLREEKIVTKAGTFNTFVIEWHSMALGHVSGAWLSTIWFAPELGYRIKGTYETRAGLGSNSSYEIASLTIPGATTTAPVATVSPPAQNPAPAAAPMAPAPAPVAKAAPPATPAPTSTAPLASSVAERLQTLKDLLDRKVITPEEYAAKRKEILKSL